MITLFDGAFGTYYAARSNREQYPEMAVLNDEETVFRIHREYIEAGATAIKTDSFVANASFGLGQKTAERIIRASYALACRAAGEGVRVFADIGPNKEEDAAREYLRVAESFAREGARNFLFETQTEASGICPAIRELKKQLTGSVVIASFAVSQDGYSARGEHYLQLLREAHEAGADYVGLNCICGPAHMLRLIERAVSLGIPLCAMPNAGYPTVVNGRMMYIDNPAYYSDKLSEIYRAGAAIIGGCCGTTPDHIRETALKVKDISPQLPRAETRYPAIVQPKEERITHKIIAVEVDPPVDTDLSFALDAARQVKEEKADYITVPDAPLARSRADSLMISALLQRHVGLPCIPHLACRDRNRIAMKGQLVAGNIEGLRHVLCITGDALPPTERTAPGNASGLNAFELLRFISSLNEDLFRGREYGLYAALNINTANFEVELNRARKKKENGAKLFFTQPIYTHEHTERIKRAQEALHGGLMAGVMPVASYRNAVFLNNEVPGITVPEEVLRKLKEARKEEVREIAAAFCRPLIDEVFNYCDGFYLMTPLKRIDFTTELIRYIREKEKTDRLRPDCSASE